ncbi:ROK family protein [Gryllotalpicola ginsengisoli]|uniref:ROK family protein n=1 Tax=Gryllotalpicola ginsengisoli TaxID=444608 RepID=UPI0003B42DE9|nr:ROK family protein [Gryllotalpicola ginsengisoli]
MTVPSLGAGAPVLAFDVGGTDLKAALVGADGALLERVVTPTPPFGPDSGAQVVEAAAQLADRFAAAHPGVAPQAAALVVPGVVDDAAGVGVYSENLGWRDVPFRALAEQRLGLPVGFGHDVRAAGLAEQRLGAAAGFRDVVVLTIGTGIAGAVFVDGRLHAGRGYAGEIGHAPVADGPECACGGRGHLEAVSSAAAIARRYNARTGAGLPGAREVLERMRAGDEIAREVWDSALDGLAFGLAHVVAVLAPEAIVIGGGLVGAGPALFEPVAQRLDALLSFNLRPLLLPASIGPDAGVVGAALLARDRLGHP